MIIKDFEQLSSKERREFLINSCQYITSVNFTDELITDLFYCHQGNFFIEVFYSVLWEKFLEMNPVKDTDQLSKYMREVDFSEIFEALGTGQ